MKVIDCLSSSDDFVYNMSSSELTSQGSTNVSVEEEVGTAEDVAELGIVAFDAVGDDGTPHDAALLEICKACPYDQSYDIDSGVTCFFPDCNGAGYKTWGSVLKHMRNVHKCKVPMFTGTWLHVKAKADMAEKQHMFRRQGSHTCGHVSLEEAIDQEDPNHGRGTKRKSRMGKNWHDATPRIDTGGERVDNWIAIRSWINCDATGTPFKPIECAGPCNSTQKPGSTRTCKGQQKQTVLHMTPGMSPELLVQQQDGSVGGSTSIVQQSQALSAPPNADIMVNLVNIESMLKDIYKDPGQWRKALPDIRVRTTYLQEKGPKSKHDACLRATWPKHLVKDMVPHDGFKHYLGDQCNKKANHVNTVLSSVGRILGSLEIDGKDAYTVPDDIIGAMPLVAFYTSNASTTLFNMDLLHCRYTWTLKMIDSMFVYCTYHIRELTQLIIKCEPGPWQEYINVLKAFQGDLRDGVRKRCVEKREQMFRRKFADDRTAIKGLPSVPDMQDCVKTGYMMLRLIHKQFHGSPTMTARARCDANAIISGGIYLDTFGGRKYEWQDAENDYIMTVLANDQDFIICSKHKTDTTYGDIAKYLSPGLRACFKCYSELPRPEGFAKFLVSTGHSPNIDISCSLRRFVSMFWPLGHTPVQVNYMRKYFHTALHKMVETPDKLKALITVIDAHGARMQGKTYILSDPEDDVCLAKELVNTVFGQTVAWPSDEDVSQYEAQCGTGALLSEMFNCAGEDIVPDEIVPATDDGEEHVNEDEVELEYYEGMEAFLVPLTNADSLPICNLEIEQSIVAIDELPMKQRSSGSGLKRVKQEPSDEPTITTVKKYQEISQEKRAVHTEYTEEKEAGTRLKVDQSAKKFMETMLRQWQQENGKENTDLPYLNEWYFDLRVEAIKAGLLDKKHSQDVCRSYLKPYMKKFSAMLAASTNAD